MNHFKSYIIITAFSDFKNTQSLDVRVLIKQTILIREYSTDFYNNNKNKLSKNILASIFDCNETRLFIKITHKNYCYQLNTIAFKMFLKKHLTMLFFIYKNNK